MRVRENRMIAAGSDTGHTIKCVLHAFNVFWTSSTFVCI
jgi:hypothetical protein